MMGRTVEKPFGIDQPKEHCRRAHKTRYGPRRAVPARTQACFPNKKALLPLCGIQVPYRPSGLVVILFHTEMRPPLGYYAPKVNDGATGLTSSQTTAPSKALQACPRHWPRGFLYPDSHAAASGGKDSSDALCPLHQCVLKVSVHFATWQMKNWTPWLPFKPRTLD